MLRSLSAVLLGAASLELCAIGLLTSGVVCIQAGSTAIGEKTCMAGSIALLVVTALIAFVSLRAGYCFNSSEAPASEFDLVTALRALQDILADTMETVQKIGDALELREQERAIDKERITELQTRLDRIEAIDRQHHAGSKRVNDHNDQLSVTPRRSRDFTPPPSSLGGSQQSVQQPSSALRERASVEMGTHHPSSGGVSVARLSRFPGTRVESLR